MNNIILYRNRHNIIVPLTGNFFYLKNPLIQGGEQVINSIQKLIYDNISDGRTVSDLCKITSQSEKIVLQIAEILEKKKFINIGNPEFELPKLMSANSLSLWIHTSNKCNLNCPYCYVSAEREGKIMAEETLDNTLTKIYKSVIVRGIKKITLRIAGGEPLLTFKNWNSKIIDFKTLLERENIKVNIQIITNGTVVTQQIIDFIKLNNIGIGLSLDGYKSFQNASRFFHNGKGSFDKVEKNLKILKVNQIDPYVTTVISDNNIEGLVELTSFFLYENLRFRFSVEKSGVSDVVKTIDTLKQCYNMIENNIFKYSNFLSHRLCDISFDKPIIDTPCGVGRKHASINFNGNIHTCQTKHFENSIGNIYACADILEQIQNQKTVLDLSMINENCINCRYRYMCAGGCPVNKIYHKSPFCHLFQEVLPIILRIRGLTILNLLNTSQTTKIEANAIA